MTQNLKTLKEITGELAQVETNAQLSKKHKKDKKDNHKGHDGKIKKIKKHKKQKKLKPLLFIETNGNQFSLDYITERFASEWQKNHDLAEIDRLCIFFKTEESAAYCLVNDSETVRIKL